MAAEKDTIFGKLAVARGYLTGAQLDEARKAQRVMQQQLGVEQPLPQVLIGKGLLTADQAQDLENAVAVETGEARLVAGYVAGRVRLVPGELGAPDAPGRAEETERLGALRHARERFGVGRRPVRCRLLCEKPGRQGMEGPDRPRNRRRPCSARRRLARQRLLLPPRRSSPQVALTPRLLHWVPRGRVGVAAGTVRSLRLTA